MSPLTGAVISLTGLLLDLTMTSIENLLLQTHMNQTIIALSHTSMFQYLNNSSPWYESIVDELFIPKRERRQAEMKWRNTKLTIFKDSCRQTKHKVSKLGHTAKCKSYNERIALAYSCKELSQVVNTLSNRHPPKILPTIYPSADLPIIFFKQSVNKVEKLRANIASEHITSTLVTGTTAATFSSFEIVSQLTVKECILNSAPKSCELDPIPSKL